MSGLAWRARAIEDGELSITHPCVRVSSSPTRAAALVEKLEGTLSGITWRKGILFAEGHWVLTLLGVRHGAEGEFITLSVTFKKVDGMPADPQEDGFAAVCRNLHLNPDGIERIDRYTPSVPYWAV